MTKLFLSANRRLTSCWPGFFDLSLRVYPRAGKVVLSTHIATVWWIWQWHQKILQALIFHIDSVKLTHDEAYKKTWRELDKTSADRTSPLRFERVPMGGWCRMLYISMHLMWGKLAKNVFLLRLLSGMGINFLSLRARQLTLVCLQKQIFTRLSFVRKKMFMCGGRSQNRSPTVSTILCFIFHTLAWGRNKLDLI